MRPVSVDPGGATFSTIGAITLVMAGDLLSLFLGLETMSLGVYAMTGFRRASPRSAEAAVKYFLLGAFSLGILLYGMSLLYGLSGTTNLRAIATALVGQERDPRLVLAVILVVLVMFLFLRSIPATLIPSLSVPLSLVGTLAVMYLAGFSLNNLSLMALTIATGFVVDDAIVVLENISRHMEHGMPRMQAAFRGAQEVGFTVLSISLSLIAVFLPILLMGGILGRLFREFTVTLSIAILISLAISLTTIPIALVRLSLRLRAMGLGR